VTKAAKDPIKAFLARISRMAGEHDGFLLYLFELWNILFYKKRGWKKATD